MVIALLFILGLVLGSFVSALVFRLHEQSKKSPAASRQSKTKALKTGDKRLVTSDSQNLSILRGRSMCAHCKHQLSAWDLIPVFSWLYLRGKCRYCQKKIDDSPLVEISLALLFVASYVFWPMEFNLLGSLNLVAWLLTLTGLMALLVYDLRWMILPNRIVYPLLGLALAVFSLNFIDGGGGLTPFFNTALSVAIAGGLFYALFQFSDGKWIGGGDVKLGFLIGLLVASPQKAFLALFIASLLGTIIILPGLATKKLTTKSRVPFGPFLIMATIITVLFGASLIARYKNQFLLI